MHHPYQVRTVVVQINPICLPTAPAGKLRDLTASLVRVIAESFPDAQVNLVPDLTSEVDCFDIRVILTEGQAVDRTEADGWRTEVFRQLAAALHKAWSDPPSIAEEPQDPLPRITMDVAVIWRGGVLTGEFQVV